MPDQPTPASTKFKNRFRIYKPNRTNTGSALQMDLNAERAAVFLEVANQTGEQAFDWANKITFKLATTDIGKMLAVFNGRKPSIDLFHDPGKTVAETDTKSTSLKLSKGDYGFFMKVTTQSKAGALRSVSVPLAEDEAEVARVLLEAAIARIYDW